MEFTIYERLKEDKNYDCKISKMKHKSKTMLEVIRGLVLDFFFFTFLLCNKVSYTCNFSTGYNTRYITNHLMPIEY